MRRQYFNSLDGLRLGYVSEHGQAAPCVFPTPGWGPSLDLYKRTLAPLSRIFSVQFLETRGSGFSEHPDSLGKYSYDLMAMDIESLRLHLGLKTIWVIGHSLGGVLAMTYSLNYSKHCAGIILIDSYASSDASYKRDVLSRARTRHNEKWYPRAHIALDQELTVSSDSAFKTVLLDSLPFYFHDQRSLSRHLKHFLATNYSLRAFKGWGRSEGFSVALLPNLSKIAVPVIVIVGANDFICSPAQSQRIHLRTPGSKLIVIEEAGHFPWLEQQKVFFQCLREAVTLFRNGQFRSHSRRLR